MPQERRPVYVRGRGWVPGPPVLPTWAKAQRPMVPVSSHEPEREMPDDPASFAQRLNDFYQSTAEGLEATMRGAQDIARHPVAAAQLVGGMARQQAQPLMDAASSAYQGASEFVVPLAYQAFQSPTDVASAPAEMLGREAGGLVQDLRNPETRGRTAASLGAGFTESLTGAELPESDDTGDPRAWLAGALLGAAVPLGPGQKVKVGQKAVAAAARQGTRAPRIATRAENILSHLDRAPVDIDNEGRMFVSTRVPSSKTNQIAAEAPLNTGLDEVLQDPKLTRTFANNIRESNLITRAQAEKSDEHVIRAFLETGTENVRYMIDKMEKGGWADSSRLWYNGANNVSNDLASTYGIDPNASYGVVAVLSPQKEWNQNAEMAKRVVRGYFDFNQTNPVFDRDVFNRYKQTKLAADQESINKLLRDGKIKQDIANWSLSDLKFYLDQYGKDLVGRRWQDLSREERAIFLRAYDELNNGQRYPILSPDGTVASPIATNADGSEAKMAWQSYGAIEKALSILDDPSPANISQNLGGKHKVRAFFDNISRPEWGRLPGQRGPSTVDTHQVAMSHFMPYGAASPVVKASMGGAGNARLGISGMNPLYQEMLTQAVQGNPNDYLPRSGQSISWDGIKSLFSPEQKRNPVFVDKIRNLWSEYQRGRMSLRGVQDAIVNEAGGIKPPEWAKRK